MDSARRSNGWPSIFTSRDALTSTQQTVKALARLLRFAPALRVTVCSVPVDGSYAGKHSFPASPPHYDFSSHATYYAPRSVLQFKLELKRRLHVLSEIYAARGQLYVARDE